MILAGTARVYVCAEPVDMRKSIDGLSQLVAPLLKGDPFSGSLFVFLSRRREKVKILWWDRHGFWLGYKRLERGRFPRPERLASRALSVSELTLWLEGVDLLRTRRLAHVQALRVG
ncbi:MAG: IS66 family insertion sequence element accessory protein TnpB [Pseudomonadota bacterium]